MKKIPYLDILKSLLPDNEWEPFLESYSKPLPKSMTVITHKISIKDFEKIKNTPLDKGGLGGICRPGQHFLHQGGFFYIQEQAASLPAQVLLSSVIARNEVTWQSEDRRDLGKKEKQASGTKDYRLKTNELILDMCAAPGGKSIQLADAGLPPVIASEAWQSSGNNFIVSNEPIDPRRKALIFNINRTGCYNTMITNYDGTKIGTLFPETFDKILIDAPCSGEGMNYKIAIQQSRDELKIKKIASLQYQLLKSGILACKLGGTIIYSTCTLNPIENEGVIANIMQEFSGKIELENVDVEGKSTGIDNWRGERIMESNQASKLARFRPHRNGIGGFFIAKIKKTVETPHGASHSTSQSRTDALHASQLNASSTLQSEVRHHLQEEFGIERNDNYLFLATVLPDKGGGPRSGGGFGNIYITSSTYKNLPDHLKNNAGKIGIPIYDIGRTNNRIPTHHLGNILGHLATKNIVELTDQQAQNYSDHKDILLCPPFAKEEVSFRMEDLKEKTGQFIILTWQKKGFSIGKYVDGRIKNKMI